MSGHAPRFCPHGRARPGSGRRPRRLTALERGAAAWRIDANAIRADAAAENQAVFSAFGRPSSPDVILTVFGRTLESDRRAFVRFAALEPPNSQAKNISRLIALWSRHRKEDEAAFAELSAGWNDRRFREWMGATYPLTVDLEEAARTLGVERCGNYFSPARPGARTGD